MVRSKDEIMEAIKTFIGDSTEESHLALIADVSDTMDEAEKRASSGDWEKKYNDLAAEYKARFFSPVEQTEENDQEKPMSFEDLFTDK